jgi:hypothetical protein
MSAEKLNRPYRVITFLNREDLDFLDELEKDMFFTHGIHIPRAKIIEEIIEAFHGSGMDKDRMEEELLRKFKKI